MKIIGICGTPRENGNTEILLKEALKSAESERITTELIILRDKNIELCDGCCICDTTKKCHIQDDMNEIIGKLVKADALIFAAPTYFADINALTKNFLDRLNPVGPDRELKNRKVGIIVVGATNEKSFNRAIETLTRFSEIELMNVIGTMWAKAYKPGEVSKNENALKEARDLGIKIVKSTKE